MAKQYPDIKFTIRTHSGNNNKKFDKLIRSSDVSNLHLNYSGSLIDILKTTDYVFTQATTAGLEAMSLGIPAFCLNLHSDSDATPYSRTNSKYIADCKDSLSRIIQELQQNSENYLLEYKESKSKLMDSIRQPKLEYSKIFSSLLDQEHNNEI